MMRERYEKERKIFFKCGRCWQFKEASKENFYVRSSNPFWFSNICKLCDKEYHKKRYIDNRDYILNKTNNYYHTHREKYLENYINKRESRLKYAKDYREKNIERIRESKINNREKYANNRINNEERRNKHREWELEYRHNNRDKINERRRQKNRTIRQWYIHWKTSRLIKELWIRPNICPICWKWTKIEAHHPDYNKRNEIVFCCNMCHQRIHFWWFDCPPTIDLLKF